MPPHRARALAGDLVLYAGSAGFAALTAATSTLPAHRAWGGVALPGYAAAAVLALGQLAAVRYDRGWSRTLAGGPARVIVLAVTWCSAALLPLVCQAVARAAGRTDRAQEEVVVVEDAGRRLVEAGTPYLGRAAIAALPAGERLLGYTPYQPGMALFGLPRALAGEVWCTDARVWFAIATAAALAAAAAVLRPANRDAAALVRVGQMATVLPLTALTLATGGDDLPVLALCLLALALAARGRTALAGAAVGAAGALKLFAWPVAVVLLVLAVATAPGSTTRAVSRDRLRALARYALPAFGVPLLALLPAVLVDPGAAVENVIRFPFGHGLVTSPAQSPLPGRLIAQSLPAGRTIALVLLVALALGLAGWLLRRPPRTAAAAAVVCAVGLAAAIALLPATRFGYLLYPVAYAFAVPALRRPSDDGQVDEAGQVELGGDGDGVGGAVPVLGDDEVGLTGTG